MPSAERHDRRRREQRGASHQPDAEREIPPERVEPCASPLLADSSRERRRPAQFEKRLPSGLRGVESAPDLLVDREVEGNPDLFVQVAVHAPAVDQVAPQTPQRG